MCMVRNDVTHPFHNRLFFFKLVFSARREKKASVNQRSQGLFSTKRFDFMAQTAMIYLNSL